MDGKYTLLTLVFLILISPVLGVTLFPEVAISPEHFKKVQDSIDWKEIKTIEDLYSAYPERLGLIIQNIDRLTSDRPREIEVLWHWHPDTSVRETGPGVVSSTNQRGNLKILSAGNPEWSIDFVRGQENPVVQGWYSKEYNMYEPNTTTIYSCHSNSGSTFVWVLFPFENSPPEVNAEITEQDIDAVKVRVTVADHSFWDVNVPFMNSSQAAMEFTPE